MSKTRYAYEQDQKAQKQSKYSKRMQPEEEPAKVRYAYKQD